MKLHEQVKQQRKIISQYEVMIKDIKRYIGSEKFTHNPMDGVNPQDLFLRFEEHQRGIATLEYELI